MNSLSQQSQSKRHARLPKISIATFDGNPLQYQSFMDSYESSINSSEQLTDIEKFLYLKGLLKGRALNTIEGLSLTDANYKEALNLLETRFGDKKLLIATFFDALLNLHSVKDASNVNKLRDLYDAVETNVRNLKSLGVESESFGPVLIPTILTKIPETIRLEVSKVTRSEKTLKCIHDELVAREHCKFVTKPTQPSNVVQHENIAGASLHAQSKERNHSYTCVYCTSHGNVKT